MSVRGLKTIVKEELSMRGLTYNKKAPQRVPNKKVSNKLALRQKAWNDLPQNKREGYTFPGSLNPKKRP